MWHELPTPLVSCWATLTVAALKIKFMVALRLIPCLDVANGRVVKGINFVGLEMQVTLWN